MSMTGSPTRESTKGQGVPGGTVRWDAERHPASAGPNRGPGGVQTWEWADRDRGHVRELNVSRAPAAQTAQVPKRASSSRSSKTTTPKKFEYLEALRGRVGEDGDKISRAEYVALVMLSTYASADLSSARPGHARLAEDLGYAGTERQRTVRRLLTSLTRKSYLVITHHGTNIVGNVATEYRLTLPEWEE